MRTPEVAEQRGDQLEHYATVSWSSPLKILAEDCQNLGMSVRISELGMDLNSQSLPDHASFSVVIHASEEMRQIFKKVRETQQFKVLEEAVSTCPAAKFEERVKACKFWGESMQNKVAAMGLDHRADYFCMEVERFNRLIRQGRADMSQTHLDFLTTLRDEKRKERNRASRRAKKLLTGESFLSSDDLRNLAIWELIRVTAAESDRIGVKVI